MDIQNWYETQLYMIDDGDGYPSVCALRREDVDGIALLAFTSVKDAMVYGSGHVPRFSERLVKTMVRKAVGERLLQFDLVRYARDIHTNTTHVTVHGMIVNANRLKPGFVPLDEIITHGLKSRQKKAITSLDELLGWEGDTSSLVDPSQQ